MNKSKSFHFLRPEKTPFFYGYIILLIGTIGVYCSIPGQTIGISVFTDPVKDALGLSRNQFSNAYMIGTIISSLAIGKAGVWFDRYGARLVATVAALVLAVSLLLCSYVAHMSLMVKDWLSQDSWAIPFVIMTGLFFLIRFAGQGVLTMASRNVIMIWFDRYRGKVNMFTSVALAFGFSSAPLWMDPLIENYGWQGAWKYLGFGLVVIAGFIYLFFRNNPEKYGLLPDGAKEISASEDIKIPAKKQYTLEEAKKTRAFWMYALILSFNSFFVTGLTFHIVSIFASEGFPKADAIAIFLPASVVAIIISTLGNFLSDYVQLRWYLYAMIVGGICASVGFLALESPAGIPLLVIGNGILSGFFAVLNTIVWPRFYGRKNLGAITGKVMSFLILASALAPSIFSFCFSVFNSYKWIGWLGLAFLLFMVIGAVKAKNPQ